MPHDPTETLPCEWRVRFEALVSARIATPFSWGTHDCCLWAADCVQAVTGTDPAAKWRGTYSTAIGAARLVEDLGGMEAIGAMSGGPECLPLAAGVGDVGLVIDSEGRQMLAVCVGTVWLVAAAQGLGPVDLGEAVKAWKVPHG